MDQGLWIKDHESWIMDHGSRIKDHGSRIMDQGSCFGMNGHPRRDTDVISRLSESTIEDLSFYIGVAMELMVKIVAFDKKWFLYDLLSKSQSLFIFFIWGSFGDV